MIDSSLCKVIQLSFSIIFLATPNTFLAEAKAAALPIEAEKRITDQVPVAIEFSGMLGLSAAAGGWSLTLGGPRLILKFGDFALGPSFYPSLVSSGAFNSELRPTLGFGPEASYRKVTLFAPSYFVANRYLTFIGVGYRF